MHEERKQDHTSEGRITLGQNQIGLRFREREKCLRGEKTQIYQERLKKMKSEITLDLFIENAS